jgi:ABC-type lipoprotein release transport system permease subunit
MELIIFPLVFLTAVILIVSLIYITSINRSKEKLALIEKGLNPDEYIKDRFFLNAVKAGVIMVGVGLGFLAALIVDEYLLIGIDNPAIYPACIFSIAGISLIIYYAIFKSKVVN